MKVGLEQRGKQTEQREKQKRTKPNSRLSSAPVSWAGKSGQFCGGLIGSINRNKSSLAQTC